MLKSEIPFSRLISNYAMVLRTPPDRYVGVNNHLEIRF